MSLLKEIWISECMEQYVRDLGWMELVDDYSGFVDNNVIHLAEAGGFPEVLINNITYPVAMAERTDSPLDIPLDYFDTEGTILRRSEAVQLAYNKMASLVRGHAVTLQQNTAKKGSHGITPTSDALNTPVIPTSGGDNGQGFALMTDDDILALAARFDAINAPQGAGSRILVLHSRHFNELLKTSQTLRNQQAFQGAVGSLAYGVGNLYGFDIRVFNNEIVFNKATGVKAAFGAAPAPATDTIGSFAFVKGETMKALGDMEFFYRLNDPEQKGDIINYQMRFMMLPKRNKYIGAIYSPSV